MIITANYLTIDIGGSSVKYAVMDENLIRAAHGDVEAPRNSLEEFVSCIGRLYDSCKNDIEGIAISLAGTINPQNGYIFLSGAFPFLKGTYISDILREQCPVTITVENDANSTAIAELYSGCLQGTKEAVAVILGSSIGGAVIHNGEVYYGKHFCAAEFSLIKTDPSDDSLHHLWRNMNGKNGLLRLVQKHLNVTEKYTGIEIFDMANAGNEKVRNAIDEFCHLLAVQIYNLQAVFDSEKILLYIQKSFVGCIFLKLHDHLLLTEPE